MLHELQVRASKLPKRSNFSPKLVELYEEDAYGHIAITLLGVAEARLLAEDMLTVVAEIEKEKE